MRYSISFNGSRDRDYGISPVTRPNIPAPKKDIDTVKIPGRSGILTIDKERYDPIEIHVKFNFITEENTWNEKFRNAKRWLSGRGDLEFADDEEYFYKVHYVDITDSERAVRHIGRFEAIFVCDPFMYLKNGKREYDKSEVLYNPYFIAHPTYLITGEGVCTLTVNKKSMSANVGQNITINTDLMVSYRTDGTIQNTAVTGDYQELYLQEGDNQMSISEGFELKVIPNWRNL